MRLQSAVFTLEDTLFAPDGAAREGLDKALSLFKMEGVWLGAVTAMRAEDAQRALDRAGLSSYFRFVLTESVALCGVYSGTMFERAMKRLHARKPAQKWCKWSAFRCTPPDRCSAPAEP